MGAGSDYRYEPVIGQEFDHVQGSSFRPVEGSTLHGRAAGADRPHCPDAHRGYQSARRIHLPDRAIPGPATTVTSGSKITRFWRLNGSSERREMAFPQGTERPLYSVGYRCARQFRPCFHRQSTGTFDTEIKGTPSLGAFQYSDSGLRKTAM